MTLDMLQQEMIVAMKAKDKLRKETISSLIAAVKKTAIDKRCKDNITEELVNEVLLKELKSIREMVDTCPEERDDLMCEYVGKCAIVSALAPQLITDEDEIVKMIMGAVSDEFLTETDTHKLTFNKADKGKIMKIVMPALKGKVDMKIANKVLGEMFK